MDPAYGWLPWQSACSLADASHHLARLRVRAGAKEESVHRGVALHWRRCAPVNIRKAGRRQSFTPRDEPWAVGISQRPRWFIGCRVVALYTWCASGRGSLSVQCSRGARFALHMSVSADSVARNSYVNGASEWCGNATFGEANA